MLGGNTLGLTPLFIAGSDELKTSFSSSHGGAEPGRLLPHRGWRGLDAGAMRTTAVLEGDEYIINGTKTFITNGGVASLYSVFAMEDPEQGNRGISAFMMPSDRPGITIGKKENKMGQRTADTREVTFEDVRIPARFRLGQGMDGFKIAMKTLDESRATVGRRAVGIARVALEAATDYAKERVQFGGPSPDTRASS